jgi:hypothetical protein
MLSLACKVGGRIPHGAMGMPTCCSERTRIHTLVWEPVQLSSWNLEVSQITGLAQFENLSHPVGQVECLGFGPLNRSRCARTTTRV